MVRSVLGNFCVDLGSDEEWGWIKGAGKGLARGYLVRRRLQGIGGAGGGGVWTLKIGTGTQPFLVLNDMRHKVFLNLTQ